MRFAFALLTILSVLPALCAFAQEAMNKEPAPPAWRNLRKPGFLFVELSVQDLPGHVKFFQDVAGFKQVYKDGSFVVLDSERGQFLLNGKKDGKLAGRVPGLEIGIVVADLDAAFAAAKKSDWRIERGIAKQPWGVRDFRVLSPDGFYLRITE